MSFVHFSPFAILLFSSLFFTYTTETTFEIKNQCNFTVWAAAVPGGGQQLDYNQSWTINTTAVTSQGRIWGRTNCTFDEAGRGGCETGDCGGLLECNASGTPPNTLAEYAMNKTDKLDFIDISLVDGFNVPLEFGTTTMACRKIRCAAGINEECPSELKAQGGCNNPCTTFKTDEYCCNSNNCGPTDFSQFFKERCPECYSYPKDDATSTFSCPVELNYTVTFCPN